MSVFVFLADILFKKAHFKGRLKDIFFLLFNIRPWFGILLFCFSYAILMVILEKDVAQGENVPLNILWFWFLFPSSIKSFIT